MDKQIEVAGETYHVKGIRKVFREDSMPITAAGCTVENVAFALIPEPWNPHDSNAVAVLVGEHHVGYIPADIAPAYAPVLKSLAARGYVLQGGGRIWAKLDGGAVWATVTVLVPEAELL